MGLMDFLKKGKEKPIEPQPIPSLKPEEEPQRFYTVQSGDSLSKIASKEYGDAQQWKKIFEANRDQIDDPNKIFPGQKLSIPV